MSPVTQRQNFVCAAAGKIVVLLCAAFAIASLPLPASAQLNYGRIYGAVTDQTGGAIAGAMVTVIDVDRGISRSLMADDAGEFSASSLLPGNYTVRAEVKGFKAAEHIISGPKPAASAGSGRRSHR